MEARLSLLSDYVEMTCIKNSFFGFLMGSIGGISTLVLALVGVVFVPLVEHISSKREQEHISSNREQNSLSTSM